ncbi:hypothetical protein M2325_001293 [Methanococcus voltae PS]|uniref:PEGA domain-containing protein n=1 Tax=Methanococcus voltae PS TaxID=523842 RepID=A0ABT2EXA7_METVO|nr:PEGA domain-containing protein [Methanococcus voltae]MCS3922597.1 hypothetical protein [Methanococcus voltae PS]
MKRIFLFLLILLSVASVSATTDYYAIFPDSYTTYTISQYFNTTWQGYTPQVESIDGNKAYFQSEKDLVRAILPISYSSNTLAMELTCYSEGVLFNPSIYKLYSQPTKYYNFTCSSPSTTYLFGSSYGKYLYSGSNVYLNGIKCWGRNKEPGGTAYGYYTGMVPLAGMVAIIADYSAVCPPSSTVFVVSKSDMYIHDANYKLREPAPIQTIQIYTEPGARVWVESFDKGLVDNSGYLTTDTHEGEIPIKLEKEGFWTYEDTITVSNTSKEFHINLNAKNGIFKVSKQFQENIYPNSISRVQLNLEPVLSAYSTRLRISGAEVTKVTYKNQILPKTTDGSYILGDISDLQSLSIEYKTPSSWGQRTFTAQITALDLEGTPYTNLETINYEVLELPFLLEIPDWKLGTNTLTVTEQKGESYSILVALYTNNTEVWSSSEALQEYCEKSFEVPITEPGNYVLELTAKAGTVKSYYSIEIIDPVILKTKNITAAKNTVANVQFTISNPSNTVKNYKAILSSNILNGTVNKTFSIAPFSKDKAVSVPFTVPEPTEGIDNYNMLLTVYDQNNNAIFSDNVVLTIKNSFLPIGGLTSNNTYLLIIAIIIIIVAAVTIYLKWGKK